uniref:Uncharacterized protein n=1 Tax=Arundo donax TaxID=35708 RepID=A0A0A9GIV0_ARUDO
MLHISGVIFCAETPRYVLVTTNFWVAAGLVAAGADCMRAESNAEGKSPAAASYVCYLT